MKKIYFAASITGGREHQPTQQALIEYLNTKGTVLTEHIGSASLGNQGESTSPEYIFTRDVKWVEEADVIIADVTTPSLGVGYELGIAEKLGKSVLVLYYPQEGKKLSSMVRGNNAFTIRDYHSVSEAKSHIDAFFNHQE